MARQRGVVLVVAMLILLVITIVGVTSMQSTILEETMAGAVRDKHIAFNAAEAALREGENYLTSASLPSFSGNTNGRYSSIGTSEELWKSVDWSDTSKVSVYSSGGLIASTLPNNLPRYIIEELPKSDVTSPSVVVGFGPMPQTALFQITARGVGKTGAVAILQSTYLR